MTSHPPNSSQFPQYRPVTQAGQQNMMNKSFNTPQMKGQMGQQNQSEGQQPSTIHQNVQNRTMGGFSGGFGRFS